MVSFGGSCFGWLKACDWTRDPLTEATKYCQPSVSQREIARRVAELCSVIYGFIFITFFVYREAIWDSDESTRMCPWFY